METQVIEVKKPTVTNLFSNKEAYLSMKSTWAKFKGATPAQHLMYNLLRGKDLRRGFTPATNPVKLANGAAPEYALNHAIEEVKRILIYITEPDRKTWNGLTFKSMAGEFLLPFGPGTTFDITKLAISKLK